MPILEVTGLTKSFLNTPVPVVREVSFAIGKGEIVALLGPSGCGKTTTLRLIAGFEAPDEGQVHLAGVPMVADGRLVPPESRGIGVVFQDYALFPHLNVEDNVAFGLHALPKAERAARVKEVMRAVGLSGFERRSVHELSGGQQQRVAVARTLAPAPPLVLLDEPFSGLDALLRNQTRLEIRALLKARGMSALLVTHDQEEALSFADRVAVMRGGRIEQMGTPEEVYYRPRTLFVAQFLGRTNLLFGMANGQEADTPLGRVVLDRAMHGQVLLSLRPEHVDIEASDGDLCAGVAGQVSDREFRGHDVTFRVRVGGAEFMAHTHNRTQLDVGDRVVLRPIDRAVVLESQM